VAESMTMISMGQRAARARLAALFPEAVAPARQRTGYGCMLLLASQKHAIELGQRPLQPGGPAMIALVGAFGAFHLAQKRVALVEGEAPVGAYRAVAGHGGEQLVALLDQQVGAAHARQVTQHSPHQ